MGNNQNAFDLDLDVLTGKSKIVKMNGRTIEIFPPSLDELFNLQELASKFKGMDATNLTDDQAKLVFSDLQTGLLKLIPGLASVMKEPGFKGFIHRLFKKKSERSSLTVNQVYALINLVIEMSVPNDLKELEKNNITIGTDKKK